MNAFQDTASTLLSNIKIAPTRLLMWLSVLAFVCISSASPLSAQQISAQFKPSTIYPDQLTKYVLSIQGSETPSNIDLPNINGLSVISTNSSRNISFSSGRGTVVIASFEYTIRAERPGDYTMPNFTIKIDGRSKTVPAAKLRVLQPSAQRQQQLEEQERKKQAALAELFALKLSFPQDTIYYGQAIPVEISLYQRNDIRLSQAEPFPQRSGDAFSSTPFSDQGPVRQEAQASNGQRFIVYTWSTLITPLKTGRHSLQFSFEAVIGIPKERTLSNRRRNSLFDNFFGGSAFYEKQAITVSTDLLEVDVKPLPSDKKPEVFTGGIGLFTMNDLELSDTRVKAGEPITLTLNISGRGNFNRIEAPTLNNTEGWQTYDPEEKVIITDELGYEGSKQFEYTIIPESKATTQTPSLSFSYFDPRSGQYITYTPEPLNVEVIPSKAPSFVPLPQPTPMATASNADDTPKKDTPQLELLPIKLVAGTWVQQLAPAFTSPFFIASQVVPFIAILTILLFRKQKLRLLHDEQYARKLKASKGVQTWLNKAKQASEANNASDFYNAATRTLQEFVGGMIKQEPESMTLDEIQNHFIGHRANPEHLLLLNEFFEANDALKFSGGTAPLPNASEQYAKLHSLISELQKLA